MESRTEMTPSPQRVAAHLPSAFIGRQPIFDRQLEVYGYELLFRSGHLNAANVIDREMASARVVLDSLLEFGLDALVAERRAFINAARTFLVEGVALQLPPERAVIEILEDVPCDADVVRAVEALAAQGYRIALDDFVFRDELKVLLPHTSIVKLDISLFDEAGLSKQLTALGEYPLELVAERVETAEDFRRCRALGFHYFQGFFFARPEVVEGRRVAVERLAALRVLALLANDNTPVDRIVEAMAGDVKLSYQILRAVNSAWYGFAAPIESLRDAMVLLGRNRLRAWLSLIALAGTQGRSPELLTLALVRAKMCEGVGAQLARTSPGTWFTAGLFSALDLFFAAPLDELVAALPLAPEIAGALVHRSGRLGEALSAVVAFERGAWEEVRCEHLAARDFTQAYREAIEFAREWEAASRVSAA